jgi:hypothetical protein
MIEAVGGLNEDERGEIAIARPDVAALLAEARTPNTPAEPTPLEMMRRARDLLDRSIRQLETTGAATTWRPDQDAALRANLHGRGNRPPGVIGTG